MPSPQALPITLSDRQQSILRKIARRSTNPYRLVRRKQLILFAAQGVDNTLDWATVAIKSQPRPSLAAAMARGIRVSCGCRG